MARKKNVTFNDIAQYTHFSKTTISRYFNNPDSLTPENQQIISDALDKLNYKENKVAKILANGQTEFVGVLIPSLSMNYYSEMLNQILASYEKYGYKFLVFAGNGHDETEHRYIQELMSYKIEGLIVLSHTLSSRELSDLQIPVVAIEREDQFVSSVNTDNYLGAYEATSLLIHNHCDVLIHLNSPTKENIPAYRRLAGFQDACVKAGVPHKVIIRDFGLSYQEAAAPLQEIFDNIEQKYAGQKKGIFLSNDDHANILLNLLIRKYHTLPDDYELIGFDGAPISEQAIYPISTVGQQIDQIADEAVSLLVSQMQEKTPPGAACRAGSQDRSAASDPASDDHLILKADFYHKNVFIKKVSSTCGLCALQFVDDTFLIFLLFFSSVRNKHLHHAYGNSVYPAAPAVPAGFSG